MSKQMDKRISVELEGFFLKMIEEKLENEKNCFDQAAQHLTDFFHDGKKTDIWIKDHRFELSDIIYMLRAKMMEAKRNALLVESIAEFNRDYEEFKSYMEKKKTNWPGKSGLSGF